MATSKKKTTLRIASNRPDEMSQGGLPSGFAATIAKVRYVPWDYAGNRDMEFFAVRVDYQPDEESGIDPFSAYYNAGKLAEFLPATEDEELVDIESWDGNHEEAESVEGVYAAAVGARDQLSKSSNWADYVGRAIQAGFPKDKVTPDVRFLEGAHGYFERVAQQQRSGIVADEGEQKKRDILVMTKYDAPNGSTKGATSKQAAKNTAVKAKAKETEEEVEEDEEESEDSLDGRITNIIVEALAEADDNTLPKGKVLSLVSKKYVGKDKNDAIKRVAQKDFLTGSEMFTFNSEENTLTLGAE